MTAAQTKRVRKRAVVDERYSQRKKGTAGAEVTAARRQRAREKATRKGKSYGYSKK